MYKEAIQETPLEEKVEEIKSKANYTKISELPQMYLDAVISVEDHRFYKHSGIDVIAIGRALINDIKAMDFDKFYEMALPHIKNVIKKDLDLKKIAEMVKTRIEIFPDIEPLIDFFEELPEYDVAMYTHKKMKTTTASSLEVLKELLPIFEELTDYSNDSLYKTLLAYVEQKGCKNGYAMWPVRTAVSGKQMTPAGATEIMEIIGKEESLKRIRKGIELLENASE